MSETKFGSGKEAMDYLFGRSGGPRQRLDVQLAEALASSSTKGADKPPRPAKAKAPRAPKPAKARPATTPRGSMTKAQYLASLPPPLSMEGAGSASRADVVKRIREEIAGAIRAGALPEGTKVSVHVHTSTSINVDITKWPAQVFVNAYQEHLMDPKGTPWTEDYRYRGDYDKRDWDPRLTDDLNRAVVFLEKLRERHNYNHSDSMSDYFNVGYYGRTSARDVMEAAEKGIKLESNKEFADLLRRGEVAARAIGPAAAKSICGSADLRSADASCLEHMIKVAERAKGRPVEYDASRRGWWPIDESKVGKPELKLGGATYYVVTQTESDIGLAGKRGGMSSLVRNDKKQDLWAHVQYGRHNRGTVWYRRAADGTFSRI